MTAELIVMNKNGIALAADSAVTISAGGQTNKVYNSANKLFSLSKFRPVGVMIYGSAEIMGLPWEVVIKRYRELLGKRSFDTFLEYVDDFLRYLRHEAFDEACYEAYVLKRSAELLRLVLTKVDDNVKELINSGAEVSDKDVEKLHSQEIDNAFEWLRRSRKSLKVEVNTIQSSIDNYRPAVKTLVNRVLEKRPVEASHRSKLIDVCTQTAVIFPGLNKSGIVFAGFGDGDIFPSAKAYEVAKILDSQIDIVEIFKYAVGLQDDACIRAFAQSNETENFMNGISGRFQTFLSRDVKRVLTTGIGDRLSHLLEQKGVIPPEQVQDWRKHLREAGAGVYARLESEMLNISRSEFSGPVIDAVRFFSAGEMATMAQTLVSLESFRQKVSLKDETVGGPIDVCVITRGDGFIWMKRKHYFDPALNHHFFENYFDTSSQKSYNDED